jgi:hypothetical protein
LLKEAEQCLLPWGHAVKVIRIPWDFAIHNEEEWDSIGETIKDICKIRQ